MAIDTRTRRHKDVRDLSEDEVIDEVLPTAAATYGDLAARGVAYKGLPPLALVGDDRAVTLTEKGGALVLSEGADGAGVAVKLDRAALSDLVQDRQSTMGLAMTSRAKVTEGSLDHWISWEPALRALLDGRRVHESGDIEMLDPDGDPLDLSRTFTLDSDRDEAAHFLDQAGFLHIAGVFTQAEMDEIALDLDEWMSRAEPDDGESWWAEDSAGHELPVRVLFFQEKSAALRKLLADERFGFLENLTGEGHAVRGTAEGLIKPLDIVKGLSDLPWHKDCGQGMHSYMCNNMTVGISVTGADRSHGALGVIPGSHRANTIATMRDRNLDLQPIMLETATGDLTVHCSDTMHRAHPPVDGPRKVVYTGVSLSPLPDDELPETDERKVREARARLTNVQDRIEAADNEKADHHYKADPRTA